MTDRATRTRLLDAGKRLFAEGGFDDVTVRDICKEAGANLALVNYHFRDKRGLYAEVVQEAVARVNAFNALMMLAPGGSTAEEKLAHFVRTFIGRVFTPTDDDAWIHKLVQHEIDHPTEAASLIGKQAIAPRLRYLAAVIAELLDCPVRDPRVMQCVASVHGLCLIYARFGQTRRRFFRDMVPELKRGAPVDAAQASEHVIAFALAGIRAVAAEGRSRRRHR